MFEDGGRIRKLDEAGRLVLPVEYRQAMGIEPGAMVKIRSMDGGLMISPAYKAPNEKLRYAIHELMERGHTMREIIAAAHHVMGGSH